MPKIKINNADLYYEIQGDGEPLILIPGLGTGRWLWFKQVPAFAGSFRTIIFDPHGVGRSDRTNGTFTIRTLAETVAGLLDRLGIIGFPMLHSAARIVAADGGDVASNEVGELLLRGGHVCSGYWRNEEATAAALCDGWFHTGDLARQDEEGYYYIAGRAKDMIISGGENIYPAEVEAVLHAHPAIVSAALIGIPDAKWGEVPVAAIVKRDEVTPAEIIEFCATQLARYKLPKQIFFIKEFPLSASGKVLKRTLKEYIEKELLSASS